MLASYLKWNRVKRTPILGQPCSLVPEVENCPAIPPARTHLCQVGSLELTASLLRSIPWTTLPLHPGNSFTVTFSEMTEHRAWGYPEFESWLCRLTLKWIGRSLNYFFSQGRNEALTSLEREPHEWNCACEGTLDTVKVSEILFCTCNLPTSFCFCCFLLHAHNKVDSECLLSVSFVLGKSHFTSIIWFNLYRYLASYFCTIKIAISRVSKLRIREQSPLSDSSGLPDRGRTWTLGSRAPEPWHSLCLMLATLLNSDLQVRECGLAMIVFSKEPETCME